VYSNRRGGWHARAGADIAISRGMTTSVLIGLVLGIIVVLAAAYVVRRSAQQRGRIVDNTNRPGRPEPGESNPVNVRAPRDH
jgi:hypothetical protein